MKRIYEHLEPQSSQNSQEEEKPSTLFRAHENVHFPMSTEPEYKMHKNEPQKYEIVKPQVTAPRSYLLKRARIMNIRENSAHFQPQIDQCPLYFRPKKGTNRRCSLCSMLVREQTVKNTTIESEQLIVLWAGTLSKVLHPMVASEIMATGKKTYFCDVHFSEAVDMLFRALCVSSPAEIAKCEGRVVDGLATAMARIGGKEWKSETVRMAIFRFADKYWNPFEYFNEFAPKSEKNDPSETEIVPKSRRQPRKQVFEKEEHESTVKLIEQLDFQLPDWQPSGSASPSEELCRFCSRLNDRADMVRVPRGEPLLLRWLGALGAEFGRRLRDDEHNYVCRAHFERKTFSRRGKLLKGMKADVVEVNYRIRGEHFLKLGEESSGCFDLEHLGSSGAYWSLGSDQGETTSSASHREHKKWAESGAL